MRWPQLFEELKKQGEARRPPNLATVFMFHSLQDDGKQSVMNRAAGKSRQKILKRFFVDHLMRRFTERYSLET